MPEPKGGMRKEGRERWVGCGEKVGGSDPNRFPCTKHTGGVSPGKRSKGEGT